MARPLRPAGAPVDADGLHGPEPEPGRRADAAAGGLRPRRRSTRQASGRAAGGRAGVPDDPDGPAQLPLLPDPVDPRHVADAGRDLCRDPARRRPPEADPQATRCDAVAALAARRLERLRPPRHRPRPDPDHRRRGYAALRARDDGSLDRRRVLRDPRLVDVHRARLRDRLVHPDRGGGQRRHAGRPAADAVPVRDLLPDRDDGRCAADGREAAAADLPRRRAPPGDGRRDAVRAALRTCAAVLAAWLVVCFGISARFFKWQ